MKVTKADLTKQVDELIRLVQNRDDLITFHQNRVFRLIKLTYFLTGLNVTMLEDIGNEGLDTALIKGLMEFNTMVSNYMVGRMK